MIEVMIGHEKIMNEEQRKWGLDKQATLATSSDVQLFKKAVDVLGNGIDQDIDLSGASALLSKIDAGNKDLGASQEDLRASVVGFKFGQLVAQGRFKTGEEAAQWIRRNMSEYKGAIDDQERMLNELKRPTVATLGILDSMDEQSRIKFQKNPGIMEIISKLPKTAQNIIMKHLTQGPNR